MLTMHFLRLMADLTFYSSFAAFIAVRFGSGGAFGGMLLCCLVYALSSLAGEKRPLRLLALMPLLLTLLYLRRCRADFILLLPELLYTGWLVLQGDYTLSRDRQLQLFSVFRKALALIAPFVLLSGNKAVRTAGVPFILLTLVSSVLLLRALRHERRIYCRRSYQLADLAVVGLTAAAARLLSSQQLLQAVLQGLKALYETLVLPLLMVLIYAFAQLVRLLVWLLSFLKLSPPAQSSDSVWDNLEVPPPPELGPAGEANPIFRQLGLLLCVAVCALLLFLFFRWLGRSGRGRTAAGSWEGREAAAEEKRRRGRRESSPIRSIRSRYRRYLRQNMERGAEICRSSTSLDVLHQTERFACPRETQEAIRRIYVEARYGGRADRESAAEMKRLCAESARQE